MIHLLRCRPRLFNVAHRLSLVSAFSQTNKDELDCLARHARGKMTGIEVGTFMGVSAAVIAKALGAGGRLYCVDPYEGGDSLRQVALRHFAREEVSDRIVQIRSYSNEAMQCLPEKADFIFIDGDHSFEGLRLDWELVKAKLASGGIACFHDTTMTGAQQGQYCGAAEFFSQHIRMADGFDYLETCHTLNVMRRAL
jgi:predicted O-methyltransferase YrrM